MEALTVMQLEIAMKGFTRLRDMQFIDLVTNIEHARKQPNYDESQHIAEILSYQGRFQEAAKTLTKAGQLRKAIELYSTMQMWEEAKVLARSTEGVDIKDLMLQQATWCEEVGDWRAAAETFQAAGEYMKAIRIVGEQGWLDELIQIARSLPKHDNNALLACSQYLRSHGHHAYAQEVYLKMGDIKSLLSLHVELNKWDEALTLLEEQSKTDDQEILLTVYEPYAKWLVSQDRFVEAQSAFVKAGCPNEALRIARQLAFNAVVENRFNDAANSFWMLCLAHMRAVVDPKVANYEQRNQNQVNIQQAFDYYFRAEVYYAYHFIYQYTDEPFTSLLPDYLFNISRYLLTCLPPGGAPHKISRVYSLFTLAKQGKALGAYKVARSAFEKLQTLKIPTSWYDQIDLSMMTIRSKPFSDKEDLLPVCYRCSTTNPLLNTANVGDRCVNCHHPFIHSFISFDILPLVEFVVEDTINDEEAEKLIHSEPPLAPKARDTRLGRSDGNADVFTLDVEQEILGGATDDLFMQQLLSMEHSDTYIPVKLNRQTLTQLKPEETFIQKWPIPGLRHRYYRNMIPEVPVVMCYSCNHFFHMEDFEFAVLQKGKCPFCATPPQDGMW